MLGAERGRAGGVYFVTDGEPVVFRNFITELLGNTGSDAGEPQPAGAGGTRRWPPQAKARGAHVPARAAARPSPASPIWLSAQECTIDITHARQELGDQPVRSIADGMAELRG